MDIPESRPVDGDAQLDAEVAMADLAALTTDQLPGKPAGYGCPSCGGGLFELASDPVPRYRCRVGHAWSPETLLDEQAIALESALWMALRALEEKSELSRRMAAGTNGRGTARAVRFSAIAEDADQAGTLIRELIRRIGTAGSTADV